MTKQHILDEIKRTTLENKSVPLGMHRFCSVTGIKRVDWMGKYWARWGDAIREAGFEPNKMQTGYKDDYLIESVIQLALEIGHFPLYYELKMKAYNDEEFPAVDTFRINLGKKDQLILKVREYCQKKVVLKTL